ncbi:inactive tyrosine-protein kinase 7 isoform X2 [Amia ocellicauda]|uniref:inactive tyrosine-protein kinase 7 isoform X2 n=1 Tax=Amia ocellicauda TaxID=2972642 RepID=UPI0034644EC7
MAEKDNQRKVTTMKSVRVSVLIFIWANLCTKCLQEGVSLVSDPQFAVLFENEKLTLRCNVVKGTHLSYEWFFNSQPIVNSTAHRFINNMMIIEQVNSHQSGSYFCLAKNHMNGTLQFSNSSLPIQVTVRVPVQGQITLESQKIHNEHWIIERIILNCSVERGSHPRYSWYLNGSQLQEQGRCLVLSSIHPKNTGFYHCEVSDSFNDTNTIKASPYFIDMKEFNYISIEVIALVFVCYLFLTLLLTGCCIWGFLYRRSQNDRQTCKKTEEIELNNEPQELLEEEPEMYMDVGKPKEMTKL